VNREPLTLARCVALLEERRIAVCAEMSEREGSAVAACDADFSALLAERAELGAAISRLAPLARADGRIAHPRED
jgi:hypothetical protein